jgi:RNA polymerase sigma-70 factor (ECF subfamily)
VTTALPADLLVRLRLGDVAAFELLFRATHTALVAFAARVTGDEARGAEVVQDVFAELWERRGTIDVRGSARGYLFGAVRNRALNLRRRDVRERDWREGAAHDPARSVHVPVAGLDEAFEAAELRARLHAAIDALPDRCAQAMQLRWCEGLSYAEIAEVLAISVKGVEALLARGLRALRRELA